MKKERRQISDHLNLELVQGGWPALWIARESGDRVRIEVSEIQCLVQVLRNVAADMHGYQVGDCVPVAEQEGAEDWRHLVGRTVRVPGGDLGTVMGPVGDWSKAHECGCMLVSFAERPPQVFQIDDIKEIAQDVRAPLRFELRMH